ncbi:NUDIX domain-containing protein [Streptomyces sp. NPDC059466]|uniref:NUDIX domain-containing protein n=1 Tax=unclassified Streptomyces TaxID=2593676 RepID=UPI0036C015D0
MPLTCETGPAGRFTFLICWFDCRPAVRACTRGPHRLHQRGVGVDVGESVADAAVRETKEETGFGQELS